MSPRFSEQFENDSTPSLEVVEAYRRAMEEDDSSASLALVHYRGKSEEFEIERILTISQDPLDRVTGADVLAQLGWEDRSFLAECVQILIPMLKDHDSRVVASAVIALGYRGDPKTIPCLIELSAHDHADVRFGVCYALAGKDDPEAIKTLIRLSKDPDRDVRDWALFALGSQTELDSPDIRNALFEGLLDPDPEARGEAMVGLANRGDLRAKDAILNELQLDEVGILCIEAAGKMSLPEFAPYLEALLEAAEAEVDPYLKRVTEESLRACSLHEPCRTPTTPLPQPRTTILQHDKIPVDPT